MRKFLLAILLSFGLVSIAFAQDTVIVQTLTYDSTSRAGVWEFPSDTIQWRKVIMQYSMRCHDALVGNGNVGCREWDYSCNTMITDSSRTDSTKKTAPTHAITNFSGNQYNLTNSPTWTYRDHTQQQVVINSTTSETAYSILGSNPSPFFMPFPTFSKASKTQYLWTATELAGQGMTAGPITGLRFNVSFIGDDAKFLRIKYKGTNKTVLDDLDPDLSGFSETYFLNTAFSAGWQQLNFHTPYVWNGVDNLIVEFSFENPQGTDATTVLSYDSGSNKCLANGGVYPCMQFSSSESITIDPLPMANISNEITVSFWAKGDGSLPQNNSAFEAVDANNARQVNVHLPWSNGRVYFDCGGDNAGYDRIDQAANAVDYKGRWVHWAFTKNATTGNMKIWLNGQLFASGTGKTKPIDIEKFVIGSAWNGGNGYRGKLNEFMVFNAELDSATLRGLMYRDITAAHPSYGNLLAYYRIDEGSGTTINDLSPYSGTGTISGSPVWGLIDGPSLHRNFSLLRDRMQVEFVRGVYNSTINNITVRDSSLNARNRVIRSTVVSNNLTPVDTNYYYQAGWQYVYNGATGALIDSIAAPTDSTINIGTLVHYLREPSRFEIMSFVTPYGNGLDLGPNGVMWEFDLTDYSPIFHGKRLLSVVHGNYQEELDIRFVFIKGQPARDVKDIQMIWPTSTSQHGMDNIFNDVVFEPRIVALDPSSASWKIRSYITGHGQNGEFIARWHWLNVAGGPQDYRWRVWKECSDIPVYPQGGTWLYDRAGWCPGQPSDLVEFEIGNLATPGQLLEIDYGMDPVANTSTSSYLVNHQLVTYGANNFNLDASISEIVRPNNNIRHARFNPACNSPVVVIRNEGANNLTSATIEYNMKGGPVQTFNWTGNLGFLESEEVTLRVANPTFWTGTSNVFEARVVSPNGGVDAQPANDQLTSSFELWDSYVSTGLDLYWRTNNQASQSSWKLYDENGVLLLQNSPFLVANTTYTESFNLPAGCYSLRFNDAGDDGLYYWATPSNGTGFARFRENAMTRVSFESEFGRFFQYDFWTDGIVGNDEILNAERITVYPNPSSGKYKLEMEGFSAGDISLEVFDLSGKKIWSDAFRADGQMLIQQEINLEGYANGAYILKIYDGHAIKTRELIKQSY